MCHFLVNFNVETSVFFSFFFKYLHSPVQECVCYLHILSGSFEGLVLCADVFADVYRYHGRCGVVHKMQEGTRSSKGKQKYIYLFEINTNKVWRGDNKLGDTLKQHSRARGGRDV